MEYTVLYMFITVDLASGHADLIQRDSLVVHNCQIPRQITWSTTNHDRLLLVFLLDLSPALWCNRIKLGGNEVTRRTENHIPQIFCLLGSPRSEIREDEQLPHINGVMTSLEKKPSLGATASRYEKHCIKDTIFCGNFCEASLYKSWCQRDACRYMRIVSQPSN